jgi:plasmid maintenance system antidote protein VapI
MISETLRATITSSGIPLLVLERMTGVQRASIRRFVAKKQSLRLEAADRLAAYFGLELVEAQKKTR